MYFFVKDILSFRRLSNTYSRMSSVKLPGEDGDLDQTTANDISFFYAKVRIRSSI